MTQAIASAAARTPAAEAKATRTASVLVACGMTAGPLFATVVVAQGLTRKGFDFTRHAASLLSNGDLGWIQITSFLVTGALTIAFAAGMRRVLRPGPGSRWGPRLVRVFGLGVFAAAFFRADPSDGFPPGTPVGHSHTISWHGMLHIVCGQVAFLALIAACWVLARRFAASGRRGWAVYSRLSGIGFLAGIAVSATGSRAGVAAFGLGVAAGLTWMTLLALHLRNGRRAPA